MAARAELDTQDKDESSIGARIGRVRWTICAMLFVATSINYMDRSGHRHPQAHSDETLQLSTASA